MYAELGGLYTYGPSVRAVCTDRPYGPSARTVSETQRCLLKCNVQQWDGAIVVTRFRVYACAPDQTCCSESTEGGGEP